MKICEIYDDDFEQPEDEKYYIDEIISIIKDNCQEYIKANPEHLKHPLYRGYDLDDEVYNVFESPKNRRPVDTPNHLHNLFDEAMLLAGLTARRSNSIFCSGSFSQIIQYGEPCVVYPFDGTKFSWSPMIVDVYTQFDKIIRKSNCVENMQNLMLKYNYNNANDFYDDIFYLYKRRSIQTALDLEEINFDEEKLGQWFKQYYKTTDIADAIQSSVEILIHGEALLVNATFFRTHVDNIPKFEQFFERNNENF